MTQYDLVWASPSQALRYDLSAEALGSGDIAMGHKSHAELFICPNCNAQYKLVRADAYHAASYCQIECYHCGGPLNGRDGQFILKYFLVDRPRRQLKPSREK